MIIGGGGGEVPYLLFIIRKVKRSKMLAMNFIGHRRCVADHRS